MERRASSEDGLPISRLFAGLPVRGSLVVTEHASGHIT
jgi:hypothetical protein